jgi:hypothetical protein
VIIVWLSSVFILWKIRNYLTTDVEKQGKTFIYYFIISAIVILLTIGHKFIPDEYFSAILTELTGIGISVLLIERVYSYISKKNEMLFRNLLLRTCRMQIHAYFYLWLMIFKKQEKNNVDVLTRYNDLNDFLLSDDFYNAVTMFNFNNRISEGKTYAQYCNQKITEIGDKFQNTLVKYASKLTYNDVKLIEHFGGGAYVFSVFALMNAVSEASFSMQADDGEETPIVPFLNDIRDIRRDTFNLHFNKFIELVNEYNNSVDNEFQKWTLHSLTMVHTIFDEDI